MAIDRNTAQLMAQYAHSEYPNISVRVWEMWILAEGGNSEGYSNPLNLRNEPPGDPWLWTARYGGVRGANGFEQFPNWQDGLRAAIQNIEALKLNFNGKNDMQAIDVIWESPWDAGHYGNSAARLLSIYNSIVPTRSTYTVKYGDTLWGIAHIFHVTIAAIEAANPQIKNPDLIYPGEIVYIP